MPKGAKKIKATGGLFLYGQHAIVSALGNKQREKIKLFATRAGFARLDPELVKASGVEVINVDGADLDQLFHGDAPHQGLAMDVKRLPGRRLEESCKIIEGDLNLVVVLDHVTDPHNVGAIIRSAAAFGAKAIVTTDRHAPPESGALAKSASGALDFLPWVRVVNLSEGLRQLADMGYWRIGMDGNTDQKLKDVDLGKNIALVMGAEGAGIRPGTAKECDAIAKLPITRAVESLNVSNAAAIALYDLSGRGQ